MTRRTDLDPDFQTMFQERSAVIPSGPITQEELDLLNSPDDGLLDDGPLTPEEYAQIKHLIDESKAAMAAGKFLTHDEMLAEVRSWSQSR